MYHSAPLQECKGEFFHFRNSVSGRWRQKADCRWQESLLYFCMSSVSYPRPRSFVIDDWPLAHPSRFLHRSSCQSTL